MTMNVLIPIILGFEAGLDKVQRSRLFEDKKIPTAVADKIRTVFGADVTPDRAVAEIIAGVRSRGDAALRAWTKRLDGVDLDKIEIGEEEKESAIVEIPQPVRESLELAAGRIRAFHEKQKPRSWLEWSGEGGALGQLIQPLESVGIYVPGGSAPLPSSLLMEVIPAQVAGVREVLVATPPSRDGRVAPVILAAAKIAGVNRVFALGGAQAVAAFAYGTATIPRVDKIVGAGGLFTTLAKRQVYGTVGIDGLYGPTETLLIADESANPSWVAADLIAQAEHDAMATSILITSSDSLAAATAQAIAEQVPRLVRSEIIRDSLEGQGAIIVVRNLDEAIELAKVFAPEHLCLLVRDPWSIVPRIRNAGGIFVGELSSEALGDYILGPSHVMPTMGTARFASPLSVNDFCKITSLMHVGTDEARTLSGAAQILAEAEGLTGHAQAARIRMARNEGADF